MSHPGKVRALLATLRVANAPSVVSNVFLGSIVGWGFFGYWQESEVLSWSRVGAACICGVLLYFSGNLANDWFDRSWDAEKRPERALPSGLFRPSSYLLFATILAISGIGVAFLLAPLSGVVAVVICALIAIYTWFHKRAIWAVIPMGLCRASLYFLGYFVWWPLSAEDIQWRAIGTAKVLEMTARQLSIPASFSTGLFCYIVGLSLSARYEGMESAPQGPKVISIALLILPLAAMSCSFMGWVPVAGVIGMIPYAFWLTLCFTRFRKPVPRYVSALLAGIPLVDLIGAVSAYYFARPYSDLPGGELILAVPVMAFIAGRALQKVAAAT